MELPPQLKREVDGLIMGCAEGVELCLERHGFEPVHLSVLLELDAEAVTLPGDGSGRHHLNVRPGQLPRRQSGISRTSDEGAVDA